MEKVSVEIYPKNLSWDEKVFSMPNIPRGNAGLTVVLREVLARVANGDSPAQILRFEGSNSNTTLNELCIRLRPMKFVVKSENGWILTAESKVYLETNDNFYLAAMLCANVKFLGEILYYLDSPKKASQLQSIAQTNYGLTWKTGSDINSRLLWLRHLGLVEFQEFSLLYSLTEAGKAFLNDISIIEEVVVDYEYDETETETEINLSDWAKEMLKSTANNVLSRKNSIGYMIGNVKDFHHTIYEYIELINQGTEYQKIWKYTEQNYGVAQSSLRSYMTTLSNIGMIERKTDIIYAKTELAALWEEERNIVDLICILQSKFLFIIELLQELEKGEGKTYKELAAAAKVSYGFEKENIDEIRKRIIILKSAKLVKNSSIDRFTITNRAKLLLSLKICPTVIRKQAEESNYSKEENNIEQFFTELRLATRDSGNFEKLEKSVEKAFALLGFSTQWLGGSGSTDVLIHAPTSPKYTFSVAIDAKSTITGNVTDGLVDFDTLAEHKNKHKADYSAIVGGNFQNERLIKRATEHGVVLIDIDSLEKMILNQIEVPLKVNAYRSIFVKPGLVDVSGLEAERKKVLRYGKLLHAVMDCLIEESEDAVTDGILINRDVYRTLRNMKEFEETPTIREIDDMLEFLSSPLIGCVEKTKDGYYVVGSLTDASKKFEFYSKACITK